MRIMGAAIAALWAVASPSASPVAGPAGQECETFDAAGHDAWHVLQRQLYAFEDTTAALLAEAGQPPIGGVTIRSALEDGKMSVEPRGFQMTRAVADRFQAALDALVAAADLAPGEALAIDLGQPRPELWPDRTERCEAELDNVAEVGALVAQVVVGAIARERKANPAGRIRIDLWTRVDWTGRVGEVELREDAGQWGWLVPYLEARAPVMRYRPATVNGVPQTTWISQPFELEF